MYTMWLILRAEIKRHWAELRGYPGDFFSNILMTVLMFVAMAAIFDGISGGTRRKPDAVGDALKEEITEGITAVDDRCQFTINGERDEGFRFLICQDNPWQGQYQCQN